MIIPFFQTLISAAQLTELLAQHQQTVKIFDCSADLNDAKQGYQMYLQAHIAGAHYLDLENDLSGKKTGKNGRHPLPDRLLFAQRLAQLGLNQNDQVIVYDRQNAMFAARAWWLLRWLGHEKVAVLDGHFQAWQQQNGAIESQITPVHSIGNFKIEGNLEQTIDKKTIFHKLKDKNYLIIDARTPERFSGENEPVDPVGGHIPGAKNHCFAKNLDNNGLFQSPEQLKNQFLQITGLQQAQHLVLQCGSGVSACHNTLALKIAGFNNVILYPGSWSEWVSDPQMPIATQAT